MSVTRQPRLSHIRTEEGFVYGWAFLQGAPQLHVHLFVDGKHVASELTGVALPDEIAARCGQPPTPNCGFIFALPAAVMDGYEHNLHVGVLDEQGEGLHSEVFSFKSAPVRGEVRQQGRLFVGTVWFDNLPRRPAQLVVSGERGEVIHRQPLMPAPVARAEGYPAQFSVDRDEWPDGLLHFKVNGQALRGSPCRRSTQLVGLVEEISPSSIRGWAFDGADPRRPIELLLRIDGRDAAWFRPNVRRPEIARQVGIAEEGWGLVGFEMAAPEVLRDGEPHRVEVVLAAGGQALNKGHQLVRLAPVGTRWKDLSAPVRPAATGLVMQSPRRAVSDMVPVVSAVVLTRNGAPLLEAFLQSWEAHQTSVPAEIIVVDHASTDDTLSLLRRWQKRLPLTVIALDHNGSFSASSNLGASHARGQYLLLVNNDIVWLQDVLPRLLESLQDPQVGIAGLKLLKIVGESPGLQQFATEVQHLGVRFKLNDRGYWPYEAAPSIRHREAEYAPQAVPAVTGAALMCRREDFENVGGFDPAYFYGFEDVELCLRLAYRLRKAVVCRNDCVALHHHGHTRLSGRELSIYERLMRNSAVLQGHIGVWIKQAYWRSLLLADGYITSEPLTIGIVVDGDPVCADTPLVRAGAALAQQLASAMPHAEIVLLDPARDWKSVSGLHLLVVGDLRYDIRSLSGARADLLTVAWLRDDAKSWTRLPWWRHFGSCVAPAGLAARTAVAVGRNVHASQPGRPLGELLSPDRWRLRVAIHLPCPSGEFEVASPIVREAEALRDSLQRADLPCWLVGAEQWHDHPVMADVCITLWGMEQPKDLRAPLRSDTVNVLWLVDPKAKVPAQWQAAKPLVTRSMPQAQWLQEEMEKRIGSTFSPP
jgi:GT2 family glycosyltransferase